MEEEPMSVGRICVREVVYAEPQETARQAAERMVERDVGTLVVLDGEKHPVGVVTDRDLVSRVLARGRDPGQTSVESVMTTPAVTVREGAAIEDALKRMTAHGMRRLVVLGEDDELVGVLALDDVLELLAEESAEVGRLLRAARDRV